MIEVVLQYFLYRLLDQVDLEGALVLVLFHQPVFGRRRAFEVNLVVMLTLWVSLLKARFCLTTCYHLKYTRALRPDAA